MNILALSALVVVLPVVSVLVADTIEDIRFRGRFPCGCKWPTEEDGPQVVTCPCRVTYRFRPWKNSWGGVRDAWETTDEGESDD